MKGEEFLSKDSSKDVLTTKIQLFIEGRKTEYTSRDRTRKGTFFRENCLFSKIAPDKIAKTVKIYMWTEKNGISVMRPDNGARRLFFDRIATFGWRNLLIIADILYRSSVKGG